jgi:hypothetical protein
MMFLLYFGAGGKRFRGTGNGGGARLLGKWETKGQTHSCFLGVGVGTMNGVFRKDCFGVG